MPVGYAFVIIHVLEVMINGCPQLFSGTPPERRNPWGGRLINTAMCGSGTGDE